MNSTMAMGLKEKEMSNRGRANVDAIMPKIQAALIERTQRTTSKIDLSTAENWLIRSELVDMCKKAITENLQLEHLSYPRGFSGDPELLDALADFFNAYFEPLVKVEPTQIVTAPGAASCLDALFYNLCDPGDGILIPGPYWNGFDFQFQARSSVTPVLALLPSLLASMTEEVLPALEEAYSNASCKIKAMLLTNPHNPLGRRYSKSLLEGCLAFCHRHGIHFISDEVYAMTSFKCADIPDPEPFVSAVSLDVEGLGCDLSRVHTVWSPSKDFGQSGFRMGCTITQSNKEMAVGLALASNTQTSALTAIFVTAMLRHKDLPFLMDLNRDRLAKNYNILRSFLIRHNIPYIPCNAGLYVFAKLAVNAKTWEDEQAMVARCRETGVLVSAGRAYHVSEVSKGWVRIGFAVDMETLREALGRIEGLFEEYQESFHEAECPMRSSCLQ